MNGAILVSLIISTVLYLSNRYSLHTTKHRAKLVSLSAGLAVTYVILYLIPEFSSLIISRWMYLYVILGFTIFHISENTIYKNTRGKRRKEDLKFLHGVLIFLYYFIVGVAIHYFFLEGGVFVFLVPILLHSIIRSTAHCGGSFRASKNLLIQHALFLAVIAGTIFSILIEIPIQGFLGFVAGALLYIVIKEEIPQYGKGIPRYFVMGVLFMIILLWI